MMLIGSTRKDRRKAGFTLIEVLIVVVIVGVLAALVIPRFVAAPEKAIVSEANQMLGSLVRAQVSRLDTGVSFLATSTPMSSAQWLALGLTIPTSASKFTYTCTAPTCTATRSVAGATATAILDSSNNAWTCSNGYTTLSNGGCRLV